MGKLVITGIGMVTPIGTGREEIWSSLERGYSGIRRPSRFSFSRDIYCGEINVPDFDGCIRDKRFRRAASISQFALAAAAFAMGEAGIEGNRIDDTALVMGVTHGALGYAQQLHKDLIERGADAISPIHFSESVPNAPAGNVSICFGIKGPVNTIIGGPEGAIKSLMTACRILAEGGAKRALIVTSEELNALSLTCYTRLGFTGLSEGAGAAVIENEEAATGLLPYCSITGMASECNPSNPNAALGNSINCCLDMAGLCTRDVDLVMTDQKAPIDLFLKGVPAGSIIPFTGNAFVVSVFWDILLSAMAIKKDTIPHTLIKGTAVPEHINNVMVCTSDRYGSAAAILLSGSKINRDESLFP